MSAKKITDFNTLADQALSAMKRRAQALKIQGVAVVARCEGRLVKSWSSKMLVVGQLTARPSRKRPAGSNFLAIACAKAAEMAATRKDSGSQVRPPMTGETGWRGGVVARGKSGLLLAAFSGGPSEDDVKVSQAGLEVLSAAL